MSAATLSMFTAGFIVVNLFGCDSRADTTTSTHAPTPSVATLIATLTDASDNWHAVSFSSDSFSMVACSQDGKAYVYDMEASPPALKFTIDCADDSQNCSFTSLAFSANSQWLALGSDDQTTRVYDMSNGTAMLNATLNDCTYIVHSVQFSPDSALLAVASLDGNAYVYSLANDWLVLKANISINSWFNLAFSAGSRWLATGGHLSGVVQLYDLLAKAPPAPAMTFRPTEVVNSVTFSEDSAWVAVAGGVGPAVGAAGAAYIYSWDADNATLPILSPNAIIPGSFTQGAVFSKDAALLALAPRDPPVAFVYAMTSPPSLVATLDDGDVYVSLDFSPDSRWLAASTLSAINVYELSRTQRVVDTVV